MSARTPLGLIAGTILAASRAFEHAEKTAVTTPWGQAEVFVTGRLAYIPRHGGQGREYIPPQQINHPANLAALKSLGVTQVVGLCSSGSLGEHLPPGRLVVPDDYISLFDIPFTARGRALHITPALSPVVRQRLLEAGASAGIKVYDGGVYWQSRGPRLETRAEVRLMAAHADLVGMTMASEATTAQELGLAYAAVCTVDNWAHGLVETPLGLEQIQKNAEAKARQVQSLVQAYLAQGGWV